MPVDANLIIAACLGIAVGSCMCIANWIRERAARRAPAPVGPTRFQLPGAPPAGSTVRDRNGELWTRQHNDPTDGYAYGQWGSWIRPYPSDERTGLTYPWSSLLAARGPLVAQEPTEAERASETLYGPITARWGQPEEPCPYRERLFPHSGAGHWVACTLGHGHTGPHRDLTGDPLVGNADQPIEIAANTSPTEDDANLVCTCKRPDRHRPDCPRYTRTSGGW